MTTETHNAAAFSAISPSQTVNRYENGTFRQQLHGNISFRKDLLKQIDKLAAEESRSRSELIREAARSYIEKKEKCKSIFSFADSWVQRKDIKPGDIDEAIEEYRELKKRQ